MMKKIKLRFHYLLGALIFLLGVVPVWFSTHAISQSFQNSRASEYREDALEKLDGLALYLAEQDYFAGSASPSANAVIDALSALYKGGRLLIADSSLRIMHSSDGSETGRYLTMPGALKCLSERRAQTFRLPENRWFIALPVFSAQKTDAAVQKADALISTQPVEGLAVLILPLDAIDEVLASYQNNTDIINLLWIMIMAVLAPLATWFLMQPFDRMYRYFARVGRGDYSLEEHGIGYTETDEITEVVNATVSKLSEADKARGEFVQNVSHELKTPLTSVKILADSLKSAENVPVEMYREFISDISTEIDRENKIIEDLLSLVKMDKAAQSELSIERVNVNKLLEDILKRLAPIARQNSIELTLESKREVIAELDGVKMTLALTNVVENAIKYNYHGGWVRVTLDANHRSCVIVVSDSGSGIPKESIGHIFERFYRADKARSRELGGTGLGLAITKGIVDLHHGEIAVESASEEDAVKLEGVNQEVLENGDVSVTGTVFTITVPLRYIRQQRMTARGSGKKRWPHMLPVLAVLFAAALALSGCGAQEKASENPYESVPSVSEAQLDGALVVYRPSMLLTALVPYGYAPEELEASEAGSVGVSDDALIDALLRELARNPEDNRSMAALPEEVQVLGWRVEDGVLALSLSESYLNLRADREILAREAIVRTLTQAEGVDGVAFYIKDRPMTGADGSETGVYTAESFVNG